MNISKLTYPPLYKPVTCALLSVGIGLVSPWTHAELIENGGTKTIDNTTTPTSYILTTNATLNVNGATTEDISTDASTLNINTGTTEEIIASNNSTLNITSATIMGSAYGVRLNASTGTFSGSTITASGTNGVALDLVQGGGTPGSNVTVSDSTLTGVASGVTVSALSSLSVTDSRIEATGTNGVGLRVFSGDVEAYGSTITGGRYGINVLPPGTNSPPHTGHLKLDGTHVEGKTDTAILINGLNLPTPTEVEIQILNGSTLTGGNGTILDVRGGAIATVLVANSVLTGNIDIIDKATGNLTLNQASLTGDINIADTGTGNVTLDQGSLTGDITVDAGGTGTLVMQNSSQFTGNLINVGSVAINSQSNWTMAGDNTLDSLAMNQGRVTFGAANEFYQLNVGSLSGDGTFVMDVDYAQNLHDVLNVTGTATGSHNLLVAGSGTDPASPQQLTLVNTAAGDARFALLNGPVDVGTYSYALDSRADGSGGTEWFLDPTKPVVISPGTRSVLALFNTAPTVWYGELTSLRSRMGELRFNGGQAGGWVRTYGNKYNVAEASGVGYQQNQQGISLGADAPLPFGDGQWLVGAMVGYSKSELDLSRGTSGTVKSSYVGAYTTWLDQDSGYYFDGVVKVNRFKNDSKVAMSDGTRSKGNYDNMAMGGSVEFGRHIKLDNDYFVEPHTQLSAVVIQGRDYGLDNGMQAEGDRTRSLLGKLGVTAGRNFTLEGGAVVQPYLRAAMAHEFAKNNEVQVNNNTFNNDLSGSRGELGAGVAAALTDRLQVHADFDYSNGEYIEQPFGVNVGLRYSW